MNALELRELHAYDRWANRRLLDVVAGLPAAEAARTVGTQFSMPTLKGMLAHILAAQVIWFERCQGRNPPRLFGDEDFVDMTALRARWDEVEGALQQFVGGLSGSDLRRMVDYANTRGEPFALPLWVLLQHVANHSTHHRSEVATMLTMIHGSPPPTDLDVYHLITSGQMKG